MFDEAQRLHEDSQLLFLLDHYTAAEDRTAWLDRVMQLDGIEPKDLVRLHGELIAYGWVEQNTGEVPRLEIGGCPGCYRGTPAGRRALTRHRRARDDDDEALAA